MNPPVTPPERSDESPLDSDAELTWPPPEDARFATDVIDLQTRRVMSIQEAASEQNVAPAPDRAEPRHVSTADTSFTPVETRAAKSAAARDVERPDLDRLQTVTPSRRFSTRSLIWALTLIVIVQAIAMTAVLIRGRAPRQSERTAATTPPAIDAPAAAPRPAATAPAEPVEASTVAAPAPRTPADGRLLVRSDPPGATVVIDGRRRGTTPLGVDGLATGSHRVQLGTTGASVEQVVTIEAGSTTALVVPMNAALATAGWLNVASPIELQVFENGQLLSTSADGPFRLAVGTHYLDLVNEPLGYRGQQAVTVHAGEMARVRPSIPEGVLHVNAQPWANVWLDGAPAGETPLANLKVPLGQHEIRFRHPSLGEQIRQVVVSAREPARISVTMKP